MKTSDQDIDTTTLATDRECLEIEAKARTRKVLHWPELVRVINRLRAAEDERDRCIEALKCVERTGPMQREAVRLAWHECGIQSPRSRPIGHGLRGCESK